MSIVSPVFKLFALAVHSSPPLQKSLGAVAIKQNIKARRGYPVDLCMKLKAAPLP
jgi:hypothetical protein